jgi:putative protein-disulfide isomerase
MNITLHYLFDPLCGWCYGATPALSVLSESSQITIAMQPTGLFSGPGARSMTSEFAAYAWSNDQRIERLTGQRFTPRYLEQVLGDRQRLFDSGPATLALAAVSLTTPTRELDALKAIQHARYIDAKDVTSTTVLATLLETLGLQEAASKLLSFDADLLDANSARIGNARALLVEFGARGVPTLIAESGARRWQVDASAAYADPRALISQLEAA